MRTPAITAVAMTAGALTGGLASSASAAFVIGAVAGGVVGAAGYTVTHMAPDQKWAWDQFAGAVIGNALVGAFAGRSNYSKRVARKAVGAAEEQAGNKMVTSEAQGPSKQQAPGSEISPKANLKAAPNSVVGSATEQAQVPTDDKCQLTLTRRAGLS